MSVIHDRWDMQCERIHFPSILRIEYDEPDRTLRNFNIGIHEKDINEML